MATGRNGFILLLIAFCTICSTDAQALNNYEPNCDGKQVIVQLFEWKWTDIALECERYLKDAGFCGVQISPPNEHLILTEEDSNTPFPWWQRYQPVSYKLTSRSGSEQEFIDMVNRCNAVGVRIYADAVLNHMTGNWSIGIGSAGSYYNARDLDFPAVPYNASDFTPCSLCPNPSCTVGISYTDPASLRNCWYYGLVDLYSRSEKVRNTIAAYLNRLIEIGVAGIRLDASKYIWPEDIEAIFSRLNDLPTSHGFPPNSKLFNYQVVFDYNDGPIKVGDYYNTGYVTEFRFCNKIYWGVQNYSQFNNLIDYDFGMAQSDRAFIFVDDHDTQRNNDINVTTYKTRREYTQATAYTLAQDYGFTRLMSSYDFVDFDQGPPTNGAGGSTADVPINTDGTCGGGWVCEHRWNVMKQMVKFRNNVRGTVLSNYFNDGVNAVAFSRGNRGFFAMAKNGQMDEILQTGLPAGIYNNLIDNGATSIRVGPGGLARIQINNFDEPILAVTVD